MVPESAAHQRLAVVRDARFAAHVPQGFHPERPERLAAAERGLARVVAEHLAVAARAATRDELARVHDWDYLNALEVRLLGPPGYLDPDTYYGPGTREAAWFAAGGACALVEALVRGDAPVGAILCRPPGHHATRDQAMGFCLLNNIAVAAAHARALGVARVAIVDWDVHHGNGTQDVFWEDPSVLFVSLHQSMLYPHTGQASEVGEGAGAGATVNVPLPAGSYGSAYARAFDRVVLPILRAARPELILISAGYDAHARDPLAAMHLDDLAYAWMASRLREVALAAGHGRVGLVLEGGYDLLAIENGVHASLSGLLDPVPHGAVAQPAVDRATDGELAQVVEALRPHWPGVLR